MTDLKEHGVVQRAKLHIECNEIITDLQADEERTAKMKQRAEELGVTEGVIVEKVLEGGSSEGVLEVNDVIIGLGNKKIHRFADLQEALQQYRPEQQGRLQIYHHA